MLVEQFLETRKKEFVPRISIIFPIRSSQIYEGLCSLASDREVIGEVEQVTLKKIQITELNIDSILVIIFSFTFLRFFYSGK